MTYEQNKRRIAERLAKKYFPSKNELAIVAMMPLAEICLEEMAEQYEQGYNQCDIDRSHKFHDYVIKKHVKQLLKSESLIPNERR